MPTASRNLRRKRRLKRNNTLLAQNLRRESSDRFKTLSMLLAVLAQKGGEVQVTAGTMQQVLVGLKKGTINFQVAPVKDNPSEFVVRVVESGSVVDEPETVPDPIVTAGLATYEREQATGQEVI